MNKIMFACILSACSHVYATSTLETITPDNPSRGPYVLTNTSGADLYWVELPSGYSDATITVCHTKFSGSNAGATFYMQYGFSKTENPYSMKTTYDQSSQQFIATLKVTQATRLMFYLIAKGGSHMEIVDSSADHLQSKWVDESYSASLTYSISVTYNKKNSNDSSAQDEGSSSIQSLSSSQQVYDGYLYTKSGCPQGTVQIKTAKAKSGTVSTITVAIAPIGQKKVTVRGSLDWSTGKFSASAGGSTLSLKFTQPGVSGKYGSYSLAGVRNLFSSRQATEKAVANSALEKWGGVMTLAYKESNGWGGLSISIGSKGKVRIVGATATGKKISASSQLLIGDDVYCIPVSYSKNGVTLSFAIWLNTNGEGGSITGLTNATADMVSPLSSGSYFSVSKNSIVTLLGDKTYADYLPVKVSIASTDKKWTLPKAGIVVLKNGTVDSSKAGDNPSGLKLTYTAKTGVFSGSFRAYVNKNGKPKGVKFKVNGVVVGGKGFGTATASGYEPIAVQIN